MTDLDKRIEQAKARLDRHDKLVTQLLVVAAVFWAITLLEILALYHAITSVLPVTP